MPVAQKEAPEQLLDRLLDGEPLEQEVNRREICVLLDISMGRINDIVVYHPHLRFPEPVGGGGNQALRYSKAEILAWAENNPLDKIKWHHSDRGDKAPRTGLDPALAVGFLTGRYDPPERQTDNLLRRLNARAVIRRRQVIRIGDDDFSSHERGARKERRS
jgi:hypothetical protein